MAVDARCMLLVAQPGHSELCGAPAQVSEGPRIYKWCELHRSKQLKMKYDRVYSC